MLSFQNFTTLYWLYLVHSQTNFARSVVGACGTHYRDLACIQKATHPQKIKERLDYQYMQWSPTYAYWVPEYIEKS